MISQSPSRLCRVCHSNSGNYTCPRCNIIYCSLSCYKNHNLRCTENFFQERVMEEMNGHYVNDFEKMRMIEALKRHNLNGENGYSSDEQGDETEEEEGAISEATIKKFIQSEGNFSIENLSVSERKSFLKFLSSSELSRFIKPWKPWWRSIHLSTLKLSKNGNKLINDISPNQKLNRSDADAINLQSQSQNQSQDLKITNVRFDGDDSFDLDSMEDEEDEDEDKSNQIPSPPEEAIPKLSSLTKAIPSPLLPIHLSEIMYAYCFVLRLYNGDYKMDPMDASMSMLQFSNVLSSSSSEILPNSVREWMTTCMDKVCSSTWRHLGGVKFAMLLLDDVYNLLSLGKDYVICALVDGQRCLKLALDDYHRTCFDRSATNLKNNFSTNEGGGGGGGESEYAKKGEIKMRNDAKIDEIKKSNKFTSDCSSEKKNGKKMRKKKDSNVKKMNDAIHKISFFLSWVNDYYASVMNVMLDELSLENRFRRELIGGDTEGEETRANLNGNKGKKLISEI